MTIAPKKKIPRKKARGTQGSYFTKIDGQDVPCAWQQGLRKMHYVDDGASPEEGQWPRYIEAIRVGKQVALTGVRIEDGRMRRHGYVALYRVDNVKVTGRVLEFDLVERIADLE